MKRKKYHLSLKPHVHDKIMDKELQHKAGVFTGSEFVETSIEEKVERLKQAERRWMKKNTTL